MVLYRGWSNSLIHRVLRGPIGRALYFYQLFVQGLIYFFICPNYGLMKNSIQYVEKMGGKSTGEGQIALYIGGKEVLLFELCTFTIRFVQGWMYIFDKPNLWPHEK